MQNGERVVSRVSFTSAIVNDVSGYSLALRRLEEKKDYFFSTIPEHNYVL